MHTTVQFSWYEAGLAPGERKQRGHFSTPPALVDQILDACGYTSERELRRVRVLDPACGSGNFLTRAARRLCLAGLREGLSQRRIEALLQRNLWGLDPDPVACFLADMQMRLAIEQTCGAPTARVRFHLHQVDSLALPWQPCVDLLVANPPYLAAKNTDLSRYRQTHQRGQVDSYLLFLELALQAVRPGGWIGLILPDPVLARANAIPERAHLLEDCTLHHIWHLSGVFAAEVGAVVLIGQKKRPSSSHRVHWTRTRWHDDLKPGISSLPLAAQSSQGVAQALLVRQPDSSLRYLLSTEQGRSIELLRQTFVRSQEKRRAGSMRLIPLKQLVMIKRGEELGRDHPALGSLDALEDGYPLLRGGIDLHPYRRPQTTWGIARTAIRKPLERYQTPKLLVVKSTGRLQATLDTHGHVVLQTLYLLLLHQSPPDLDTIYFLLALLNSRLLRAYVYHLHTAYKLVQPQIEQAVLEHLPVPWSAPEDRQEVVERARKLEQICSQADSGVEWEERLAVLYEEQECAIRALYTRLLPELFIDEGVTFYG